MPWGGWGSIWPLPGPPNWRLTWAWRQAVSEQVFFGGGGGQEGGKGGRDVTGRGGRSGRRGQRAKRAGAGSMVNMCASCVLLDLVVASFGSNSPHQSVYIACCFCRCCCRYVAMQAPPPAARLPPGQPLMQPRQTCPRLTAAKTNATRCVPRPLSSTSSGWYWTGAVVQGWEVCSRQHNSQWLHDTDGRCLHRA
jgi:hypothetical protein